MKNTILGLHHVTAISGNAQRNLNFYRDALGLKLVKKTVNFDDPTVYHFYYGNHLAEPGSILTFFPWEGIVQGRRGSAQATETAFSVPAGSFDFWLQRMKDRNILFNNPSKRFDEEYLTLLDPDGLKLELVADPADNRQPSESQGIGPQAAIRGFKGITLSVENAAATIDLLTQVMGYQVLKQEVNRYRLQTASIPTASVVDVVDLPPGQRGHVAGGSVHHVAFRVADSDSQLFFREKLASLGYNVTEQIDRDYFKAIYFREPGGILFEIATDPPGFTVDEPFEELGKNLKLPRMYENKRADIEKLLPAIT